MRLKFLIACLAAILFLTNSSFSQTGTVQGTVKVDNNLPTSVLRQRKLLEQSQREREIFK